MMEKPREMKGPEEESRIAGCNSFEELYEVLAKLAVIPGSNQIFSGDRLRQIIEDVRIGKRKLSAVTDTFHIRTKVRQFLKTDKVYLLHVPQNEREV